MSSTGTSPSTRSHRRSRRREEVPFVFCFGMVPSGLGMSPRWTPRDGFSTSWSLTASWRSSASFVPVRPESAALGELLRVLTAASVSGVL